MAMVFTQQDTKVHLLLRCLCVPKVQWHCVFFWNHVFSRSLSECENDPLSSLLDLLGYSSVEIDEEDAMVWLLESDKEFLLKSFYEDIEVSNGSQSGAEILM